MRRCPLCWLACAAALAAPACADDESAARGAELFRAPGPIPETYSPFSCATCHDATPAAAPSAPIKPGAPLAGATLRPSFWGGQENDLLAAVNDCRAQFMLAGGPLDAAQPDARALYAYLASLEPGDPAPVAFTVVRTVANLARGDADAGAAAFDRACAPCHGTMHAGAGRVSARAPVLPEEPAAQHPDLAPRDLRLVFVEKVRHGGFLGYGGTMPPFSQETLGDGALSDMLEALGVVGE